MIKTIKQFSFPLNKEVINELTLIVHRYAKVKNYIYARFGSINGLKYVDNPREIRDEWVKTKFANQWKLALSEAFSNIKTNWEQTKKSVRKNINQRDLTNDEKHYINYILKSNELLKKAKNIKRFNLETKQYNRQQSKIKSNIKSYINKSINEFIENEKPKRVVAEDLSFTNKNRGKRPKKINRWLNSWLKGYIQNRLEYKLSANSAELAIVNPAYTSQICHLCNHFGERKGDRFYCKTHGVVDADYNASVNILQRYYDNEISLFTPYKKVKQILISRLEVS